MAREKWNPSATHMSCEAKGMIPGESLQSFLGEGASETEREAQVVTIRKREGGCVSAG